MNIFPIDTDEYITQCVTKLKMMPRPSKILILFYSMLVNHHVYYRLACLTGTFKIIAIDFSAVYYRVSLGGYQIIYELGLAFSFAEGQQALSNV